MPAISSKKNRKHIAMYIGSLNKGGAERVMCNLAEYFHNEGYKVTLVTTYLADVEYEVPHGKWKICSDDLDSAKEAENRVYRDALTPEDEERRVLVDTSENDGIDRVFTALLPNERGGRLQNFVNRIRKLRNTWKELKPDLILSFLGKNNVMAIASAEGLGIPVVVSVRSNPSREYGSRGLNTAMKLLFPKAAGVVVQTTGAKDYFKGRIYEKCTILPNSIHPGFVEKEITAYDKRQKTIVSVGRIDDNKNQILLIRSFVRLMDKHSDYKLILYGDGPSRSKFEEETRRLLQAEGFGEKEEQRIIFAGNVSEVADKIKDAEIFVLTSRQEGMPNALIEAMAMGLACISTDCPCGGPRDIIRDGDNGILISMGNQESMCEALTDALDKLMSDKKLSSDMAEKATKVRSIYSPQRINGLWKTYLDEKIAGERSL